MKADQQFLSIKFSLAHWEFIGTLKKSEELKLAQMPPPQRFYLWGPGSAWCVAHSYELERCPHRIKSAVEPTV